MQHPKENSGISNDIKENIEKGNELSITEKIKILRNHKGVSQQAISDYVKEVQEDSFPSPSNARCIDNELLEQIKNHLESC